MKKAITACLLACLLFCLTSCQAQAIPYGKYQVDSVQYLWMVSSASPDYFLSQNSKLTFQIEASTFSCGPAENAFSPVEADSIKNVSYQEETLGEQLLTMPPNELGAIPLDGFTTKACYRVLEDKQDTGYRIYLLDNEVWIGYCAPLGERDELIFRYIFAVAAAE